MLGWIAAILGPIFAKEVVDISRRRRYYLSRAVYGLALLFALAMVWSSYRPNARSSLNHLAYMAAGLFQAVSVVQYGSVFLFVPFFLCGVIAVERQQRTLELLFTTHLTNREIVLGKLASRLAALMCLTLSGLPVMSLIMLFGGIDPESLWRVLAATLLAVLFTGAHAIYFSALTRSPLAALVRTYWRLALWLVVIPLAVILVLDDMKIRGTFVQSCLAVLLYVNPIGAFFLALEVSAYNQMARFLGPWFYPLTFVLPSAWSLYLVWRAVRKLRQEPAPAQPWTRWLPLFGLLLEHLHQRGERRAQRRPAWFAKWTWSGRPVQNPLWLRARRVQVYDRDGHLARVQRSGWVLAVFFLCLVALFSRRNLNDRDCSMPFLGITWAAVAVLTAVVAGSSLVGDRRSGFLEQVLLTPLTPHEIVDGTFLAVWEHLRRAYWLPLVLGLLFCVTGASSFFGVLLSLLTATLWCTLLVWHGIACSLTARSLPAALVATFLMPLVVLLGTPFLAHACREAHGPVLWGLCAVAFVAGSTWIGKRLNVASVACYLTVVHLSLTALATCWTLGIHHREYPVLAMHPGALVVMTLDQPARWFRRGAWWLLALPCYWGALALNIVLVRSWLIRHFDELVGRTGRPTDAWPPPPHHAPASPHTLPAFASSLVAGREGE